MTNREKRLNDEFRRMLGLRREGGLLEFRCADLTDEEAHAFLAPSMSADVIEKGLPGFLDPEDYRRRYPGRAPEKYLVAYRCTGLKKSDSGQIVETNHHLMQVVLGQDFPNRGAPRLVWLTAIWHPNIRPPYVCTSGRPFAVSTTLDMICLMVGQMVQYRNYNVHSFMDKEAAEWATANRDRLPVDDRGLLDGRAHAPPLVVFAGDDLVEWADKPAAGAAEEGGAGPLVEVL
jgi:hypothetical protein